MADFTPEEIEQFREQFRKLNEELKRLGGTAFKEMPSDINDVVKSIKFLSNEINDIKNAFGSISQTLKNTISDFNSAGKLISSINNSYGKLSSLTAKVQEHISGTNLLSVKELTNIKTRAKVEVENLNNQRKLIASKLSEEGISERQRKTLLAQQLELNDAFEEQEGYLLSIDDLLEQQIIKEKEINKNLGLTGSLFKGISKTLQRFGIDSEIIKEMGDELREAAENGKVGFKDLFDITTKGFKKAMEDPMARFVLGLKLAQSGINDFKKAFEAFKEFNSIIISTARNLGLSDNQVRNFSATAVASQAQLNDKFNQNVYSTAQLTKSLQEVNEQLGLSVNIGQENNNEFTKMTQTMGLSADEATKIYKLGTLNNMSLKDTNKAISAGIVAAQKQTGVQINARQVFQEIGKLSAGITAKFQQNPEALAKAVAQAKALGTSLETAEKVSESLLNFESSIENELKAELLTGRQINVEKARYAALTGDQATLTQELADQVGSLADFQEMNVLAQRSLAEAFGLSRDEVADMLTKQETFNKLGDVSKKSAAEQLAIARERGLSEEDSLVVNLQQQAAAEKLEATFTNIKMALGDILAGPLGGLVNMMASLSKNTGLVYALLTAMAGVSLGKLILGIASMASSLVTAGVSAATITSALTFGLGAIAVGAAIAGIIGAATSANDSLQSKVNKGTAFAEGGIVTSEINNATIGEAGPEAIIPLNSPKAGEMLGINKPSSNSTSIDLTPVISIMNEVKNAISSLANRPIYTTITLDGRALGTAVGKQMETGTSQSMNTGYQMA